VRVVVVKLNTVFVGNSGYVGGVLSSVGADSVTMANCRFINNTRVCIRIWR
jgi:hypothetical protein